MKVKHRKMQYPLVNNSPPKVHVQYDDNKYVRLSGLWQFLPNGKRNCEVSSSAYIITCTET